jgi:hypothetical protein
MRKINELPEAKFDSDSIDHCFYVADLNKPTIRRVPLKAIFDHIQNLALKQGCTVEFISDSKITIKKI